MVEVWLSGRTGRMAPFVEACGFLAFAGALTRCSSSATSHRSSGQHKRHRRRREGREQGEGRSVAASKAMLMARMSTGLAVVIIYWCHQGIFMVHSPFKSSCICGAYTTPAMTAVACEFVRFCQPNARRRDVVCVFVSCCCDA